MNVAPPLLLLALCQPAWAGKPEKAVVFGQIAIEALDAGNENRASRFADKALKKDPDNADAHWVKAVTSLHMAQLMDSLGSPDGGGNEGAAQLASLLLSLAAEHFERVGQLEPDGERGAVARQSASDIRGDTVALTLPEPSCPDAAVLSHTKAEAAFAMSQFDAAEEHYTAALRQCDAAATWWVHLGDAVLNQGRPLQAIELYDEALVRDPCHWQALRFKADVLIQAKGNPNEAVAAVIRSLACNPTYEASWGMFYQFGRALGGAGLRPIAVAHDPAGHQRFAAALADQTGGGLEAHRGAAEAVLGDGPPSSPLWAELQRAAEGGHLDAAIYVHLMDASLLATYPGWREQHLQEMAEYLLSSM